jgi:hypothetical protein
MTSGQKFSRKRRGAPITPEAVHEVALAVRIIIHGSGGYGDAPCCRFCPCPCEDWNRPFCCSAPSKPRSKPKQKNKRVRAGINSESEGEASGGDISSDNEDGDEGKDLLHKLLDDGGELYKATGHGADEDYEGALFYEINGGGEEEYSTVVEVRGWVREYEARNTELVK